MRKLLRRARAGDADAFTEIFQSHAQALWKRALCVVRDEGLAADALQETAIKAWRSIPSFDGKSSLETWLTRILLNTCFDELRSRKKLIPFEDIIQAKEDGLLGDQEPLVSSTTLCEASIVDRMDARSILDEMSAADRSVLMLFYMDDRTIAEIAEILDLSDGAVRTRLSRARSRFKSLYIKHQLEDEPCGRAGASTGLEKNELTEPAEMSLRAPCNKPSDADSIDARVIGNKKEVAS